MGPITCQSQRPCMGGTGSSSHGGRGQGASAAAHLHRPAQEPLVSCISNGPPRPLPRDATFLLSQSHCRFSSPVMSEIFLGNVTTVDAGATQVQKRTIEKPKVTTFDLSAGFEIFSAPLEPAWVRAVLHSSEKEKKAVQRGGASGQLGGSSVGPFDAERPGAQAGTSPSV